jgi:hypothetical protein
VCKTTVHLSFDDSAENIYNSPFQWTFGERFRWAGTERGEFLDLPDSDWEQDLLGAMGEWLDGNDQTLKTTSELLVVAEALLFAGTALAAGGIVL